MPKADSMPAAPPRSEARPPCVLVIFGASGISPGGSSSPASSNLAGPVASHEFAVIGWRAPHVHRKIPEESLRGHGSLPRELWIRTVEWFVRRL